MSGKTSFNPTSELFLLRDCSQTNKSDIAQFLREELGAADLAIRPRQRVRRRPLSSTKRSAVFFKAVRARLQRFDSGGNFPLGSNGLLRHYLTG
jgi:hypothetical protein